MSKTRQRALLRLYTWYTQEEGQELSWEVQSAPVAQELRRSKMAAAPRKGIETLPLLLVFIYIYIIYSIYNSVKVV